MRKLLLLFLSLFLFANEAILKLDTKGHTGIIWKVLVTKNGDIITASSDKTIRVWSKNGYEKRKILGQIGKGTVGKIFAIALSPDEKYLAVGGYLGDDAEHWGNIRIYDYQSGKLIKLLKSHTSTINGLSFSDNGRYLISGSWDKTAKIWDMNNFKLLDTIKQHSKGVQAVKIINNRYALSVAYDGKINLYDFKNHYNITSSYINDRLQYLAVNKIKHQIAVCGNNKEVNIFDFNLNHLKTIVADHTLTGVNYSKDGKYLIVGAASYPRNINIYSTYDYSLYNSFKKHNNLVMAVNFIDNDYAVSCGGDNNEIYVFNFHNSKIKTKIVGVGERIWSVGIKGNKIAWGNYFDASDFHYKSSSFEKMINLDNFKISKVSKNDKFNRINTINGNYSLKYTKGGESNYYDGVLNINYNSNTIKQIIKHSWDGYRHRCFGWYKDYIVSGGANGYLKVYDKNANEVAQLVGHTGEIWSIALDGDKLVSAGDDQTIKLWDLSKIGQEKTIYPLLSIFVSKNNDYIIWSKSGYFASSVNGAKYIGYHINQGYEKEARWVDSDKYFNIFYRPDIIKYILQTNSETKALAFANQTKKVKKVNVVDSLPPEIILLSDDEIHTSKDSVTIKYKIESDTPIKKVIITQNGETIYKRGLKLKNKNSNTNNITIHLVDGLNLISIKAQNRYAMSDEVIVKIYKKGKKLSIYKPTLYVLSIGVSKYKNPEYNLGVADKDAIAIANYFKSQEGKLYKKVVIKTLTNQQATNGNILDALDWLDSEVTSKDVAIIFIAGHGINDDRGNYYFLPYNANLDRLRRTGVKWYDIQDTISGLPSKVILMADTCHSGNITGDSKRDITGAIKSIMNSGSGSVIFTATTGRGYSYEKPEWGHGAFTLSILNGLKGYADYDKNGDVSIKELDLYITNKVKQLTNGKQKPTTIIPNSIPDFAISIDK